MNESSVRKWCIMFNQGRTSAHDEERRGRPSLVTEDKENVSPKCLGGKQFANDEELKEAVTSWLSSLAVEEHNIGIEKLVPRFNKCLDNHGNYIEK
ncbi:hypothetical protein J437_LFUL006058 [Ladona fulva]|uniref:Transposase n=1 Tax=Ladona fulva TaxID=123851 RepID=A0A8K0JZP5_LADFU|nr:hypothetical protein J437_LFUL006058 [Ladona fulva]